MAGRLQRVIEADIQSGLYDGAATIVAVGGEIAFNETTGYADRANETPLRHDSVFPVFSISKALTAVALLQRVERGRSQAGYAGLRGDSRVRREREGARHTGAASLSHGGRGARLSGCPRRQAGRSRGGRCRRLRHACGLGARRGGELFADHGARGGGGVRPETGRERPSLSRYRDAGHTRAARHGGHVPRHACESRIPRHRCAPLHRSQPRAVRSGRPRRGGAGHHESLRSTTKCLRRDSSRR